MTANQPEDIALSEKLRYLQLQPPQTESTSGAKEQLLTAPLISFAVKSALNDLMATKLESGRIVDFPQYAFLGCELPTDECSEQGSNGDQDDSRIILQNTNTPSSAFLCGSQGSGKSYTLSCMLENCLHRSEAIGKLPKPLAGVVFHYDTRNSDGVCEAAYLTSLGIKVNVLVSRSNFRSLSEKYQAEAGNYGNLFVHPLQLQSQHLDSERMHRLMAFAEQEGSVPLYMEVIMRILRDMAIAGKPFSYKQFRSKLKKEDFSPGQKTMMDMRLNLLESFLDMPSINNQAIPSSFTFSCSTSDIFAPAPATLTIVDLTDLFLDPSTVCTLFDISLSLFEQSRPRSGLVVALDEAHKYMLASSASETFTNHLLTTIREQRHNATRVLIATQEPTISPKLLDLCSITLVHRFTSPEWLSAIKGHLAAASTATKNGGGEGGGGGGGGGAGGLLEQIVALETGESLLFAPSAVLACEKEGGKLRKLGSRYIKFKTRMRMGVDGGKSVLALR